MYNDEGLRAIKSTGGLTIKYSYDGSLLIKQESPLYVIIYLYDANGSPIGFKYRAPSYAEDVWDEYFYEKNLQGDIVAVYNSAGTKLISYAYNAWGEFTTTYHNSGDSTSAINNPYLYRGYYYDYDLGLYYLQSRYYDPNTCRFINADDSLYSNLLGYNLFSYCANNPINNYDPTGKNSEALLWTWIFTGGSAAAIEPTAVGEIILLAGIIIIGSVWLGEKIVEGIDILRYNISFPVTQNTYPTNIQNNSVPEIFLSEVKSKDTVDPHRRPGQKKQGSELKNKSRLKGNFKDRSNKRNGRGVPKSHTPAKDHQKYPQSNKKIKIF